MVASNEHGRAFEWAVRQELADFAKRKGLKVERTAGTLERDKVERGYFDNFKDLQENFISGAKVFANWVGQQGWLNGASKLVLERVSDSEAKQEDVTDLRMRIYKQGGIVETKNISIKHHHADLCHPRLPSLAQQCGIEKDGTLDSEYRARYLGIWADFYAKVKALGKPLATYKELGKSRKYDWLYEPLQLNAVNFLREHANDKVHAAAFFRYLVGSVNYYVVQNEDDYVHIKRFINVSPPSGFKITYPYKSRTTFLMEFDNGWNIQFRVHTISTKLFKGGMPAAGEKNSPTCINLKDVIQIDDFRKGPKKT